MSEPKIVAVRDGYRLVHRLRDPAHWPNTDVTLERAEQDAMGVSRWTYVDGWCLSPIAHIRVPEDILRAVLKMLLDTGPLIQTPKKQRSNQSRGGLERAAVLTEAERKAVSVKGAAAAAIAHKNRKLERETFVARDLARIQEQSL